jgi:hypothetical protein
MKKPMAWSSIDGVISLVMLSGVGYLDVDGKYGSRAEEPASV